MKFQKFVPLAKMEEVSDGSLNVFGLVTAEQPDLDGEICDYAGTKPFYQAKIAEMFKLTSAVAGMEPSLMPMREMHQLKAIGAGRTIEFDDAAKTIKMGFNVVDSDAILKFRKGVLIGFSQGGAYVGEKMPDPVHKGCMRYIADPFEVSGVDSPCLPAALVESMKGRTVTLQKVAGDTEEVALDIPAPADLRMMKLENAVLLLTEIAKREPAKAGNATISVEEGDFTMAKITDQASLTKAAKTISDHLEKHMEMHKALHEKMEGTLSKEHPIVKAHQAMMDHCEKCMKAAKDAGAGEEPEAADKTAPVAADAIAKAVTEALKPLSDEVAALKAKMAITPANPPAHTGAGSAEKSITIDSDFAELVK